MEDVVHGYSLLVENNNNEIIEENIIDERGTCEVASQCLEQFLLL